MTERAIRRPSSSVHQPASEETFDQISHILDQPPTDEQVLVPVVEEPDQEVPPPSRRLKPRSTATAPRRWMFVGAGLVGALVVFTVFQTLSGGTSQALPPSVTLGDAGGLAQVPTATIGNAAPVTTSATAPLPVAPPEAPIQSTVSPDRPVPTISSVSSNATPVVALAPPATLRDILITYVPDRSPHTGQSLDVLVKRLRAPLGFKCEQQPFDQFVASMEDLTEAPIIVDGESFVSRKTVLGKGITFDAGEMPLGRAIAGSLRSAGLKISIDDGYMRITARVDAPDDAPRFAKHEVSDLLNLGARKSNLAQLIRQFVSPSIWQASGGTAEMALTGDVLMVEGASTQVHHEVRRFCERLRTNRGLARLSSAGVRRWQPAWRMARTSLNRPVSLHIAQAIPFDDALRRLASASETVIWPDWQALNALTITPESRLRIEAEEASLESVLDALCTELSICYRVTGDNVLELTTQKDSSQEWETVFHRVDELLVPSTGFTPQDLIALIYDEIGSEWFAPGRGAIEYDAESRCLIARLPQPQQRVVNKLLLSLQA
ncbi:MAG: hypothetical protein AAGF97_04480 [Planctomycetota bacterium]